jgi:hypothetical protein
VALRTAAAYGLGVCAEKFGAKMAPFCEQCVPKLMAMVQHPEAREDDNEDATDCAVSSLPLRYVRSVAWAV